MTYERYKVNFFVREKSKTAVALDRFSVTVTAEYYDDAINIAQRLVKDTRYGVISVELGAGV